MIGWSAHAVFAAVQFVARPLKALAATAGSTLTWRERALLAWIAPRGIVAAAISALFALELERRGVAQAEWRVPLVFVVIIGTVVLQSLTAGPLARLLGIAEPDPTGFLVVGANPLARAVAKTLARHKIPVLLTDTQWDNVSAARMEGLRVFFGNPLSEQAQIKLDLAGLGHLHALTSDPHLNALVCTRYRADFVSGAIHALRVRAEQDARFAALPPSQIAFGAEVTCGELARRMARGADVRDAAHRRARRRALRRALRAARHCARRDRSARPPVRLRHREATRASRRLVHRCAGPSGGQDRRSGLCDVWAAGRETRPRHAR